jgi:mRNA interferase RelE/StbE
VNYHVSIVRRAIKDLAALPADEYERIRDAIAALAKKPRPAGCAKLTGRDGWRIRVGNYRVIYEIDDRVRLVLVVHIGHRRDVYQ